MQSVRPQLYSIYVYFKSDLFEYLNANEIDARRDGCVASGRRKKRGG